MKLKFILPLLVVGLHATDVKIVELDNTGFNDSMKIDFHTNNEVLNRNTPLFLTLKGFPLGVNTYSEKLRGMRQSVYGTSIAVYFNGQQRLNLRKIDEPTKESRKSFDKDYRKYIPTKVAKQLHEGKNAITIVALNSFGESSKSSSGIITKIIDFGKRVPRDQVLEQKLNMPYILYNEPRGTFMKGEPVLLDFITQNASLSARGNKVIVYIDGIKVGEVIKHKPHQILHLPRGKHIVKLELVDTKGYPYSLPFNSQQSEITVE